MKKFTFTLLFLFCALNIVSCAQEITPTAKAPEAQLQTEPKANPLVYLKTETVTVSSFDATADWAPPQDPKATIDGSLMSRWSSGYTDNQWITFDFGKQKTVSKIIIFCNIK